MNEFKASLIKGTTYAVCFWVVYTIMNGIFYSGAAGSTAQTRIAQEEYVRQQQKATELMGESERQMKRMEALITKQEENASRFANVITLMERSQGK